MVSAAPRFSGIGFVFKKGGGIFGFDADHRYDPATGAIGPDALHWLQSFNTYTEISPSKDGLHALGFGVLPGGGKKHDPFEVYDSGRFFTVTGNRISAFPADLQPVNGPLDALWQQLNREELPDASAPSSGGTTFLSDVEVRTRAEDAANGAKFRALWTGDTSTYGGDESSADMALCSLLAFWCNNDAAQMDRLFRDSGLMRPKWDTRRGSSSYGADTIRKAIRHSHETYSPEKPLRIVPPSPEADGDQRPLYKLWTDTELIDLPPPDMLIKDILPAKGPSILYSQAGVGKSFLAIDWAYRIALGLDWFGLPCMKGPVIYVAAEGQGGLGKRLSAWRTAHSSAGTTSLRFITHPIYPTRPETYETLQASLEVVALDQPVLIVIDTLTRVNEGDENSTKDMTALINAIDALRIRFDCAILLVHHRGYTEGRIRGSSALLGAADAILALEKDPDTGILTLSSNKMKEGANFEPWKLVLKVLPVGETSSCVIALAAGQPRKLTEPMRTVLATLAEAGLEGASFAQIHTGSGLAKSTLNRTLKELVSHNLVARSSVPRAHVKSGTDWNSHITTLGKAALDSGLFRVCSTPSSLEVPVCSSPFQSSVEQTSSVPHRSTHTPPLKGGVWNRGERQSDAGPDDPGDFGPDRKDPF